MKSLCKIILVIFLLSLANVYCSAQAKQVDNATNRANPNSVQTYNGFGTTMPSEREYSIEGSPYANDVYVTGNIYHNYRIYKGLEMRYDIFNDRIEFVGKDTLMIGADKLVQKVELGGQILVVDLYEVKGKPALAYFVRLDSGKMTILTKLTISLKGPQFGKPIEGNIPAKYVRMPDTQFYKIANGQLVKIQSIKKVIEELPDHNEEMEAFARKEKISANKPKELVKFSQYYNSLQ